MPLEVHRGRRMGATLLCVCVCVCRALYVIKDGSDFEVGVSAICRPLGAEVAHRRTAERATSSAVAEHRDSSRATMASTCVSSSTSPLARLSSRARPPPQGGSSAACGKRRWHRHVAWQAACQEQAWAAALTLRQLAPGRRTLRDRRRLRMGLVDRLALHTAV